MHYPWRLIIQKWDTLEESKNAQRFIKLYALSKIIIIYIDRNRTKGFLIKNHFKIRIQAL